VSWSSPLLACAVPLVGALGIVALGRWPNLRESVTLVSAVALFAVVLGMLPGVLDGETASSQTLLEVLPGMTLSFAIEPLGMCFALIASLLWPLNSLYSIGYMRGNAEQHQTRFYLCFALALASVMGIAFADNLFTLFVFYEALTLSTFPLVAHKGTPDAVRSSRTYLGILVASSICLLLPAMIGVALIAGTLDFVPGGVLREPLDNGEVSGWLIGLLYVLTIYGIGKCALMPLHRWLPAAMVAPTPVSALLHAVAVVKAGVFTVTKVTAYTFGIGVLGGETVGGVGWLTIMAGFTIITASLIALYQDNLKRRLAYSTVSQLSYIVIAASLLTPLSIMAAMLHIMAHAFGKITLFFAAGSIYTAHHKTEISQLDGIGRRMPWTMGAFTIGTLSMVGVPPTAGFISKWFLIDGAWDRSSYFVMGVIIASTLLNAGYFLPIVYRAFFRPVPEGDAVRVGGIAEAPWPIVVALCATAACTLIMFAWPALPVALGERLAELLRVAGGGA